MTNVLRLLAIACLNAGSLSAQAPPLKLLFLGDNGHHRPAERFRQIQPVLAARGIDVVYTDAASALNPATLSKYDALIVYANIEKITPAEEQALLDYVAAGKGFIPIHCASYCFLNSPKYVELVGAQFQKHGTGVFRTTMAAPEHPLMKGYRAFESWDETYVHTRHNEKDRVVLEYREEKGRKEPWTWVRTHGKGRVFYTAWGHDERTWGQEGFQELLERGIRWACGEENPRDSLRSSRGLAVGGMNEAPVMTALRKDLEPFKYIEAKVPFYPAGKKQGGSQKPTTAMQLPLPAEQSMQHMVHPVEFELKLFASDPDIKRPICMNWDERGRLWIAETIDYPNELKRSGEGRDRIVICEDTDGDGRADKFKVFADKLSIPTSFVFYRKGIIVTQAPHTLYLQDNDGDDVCDERTILFTGWHTGDTHAGPSNLVWGFDNWIYGICGYSGFDGTVGGERHSFRQGFFRFRIIDEKEVGIDAPLSPLGRGAGGEGLSHSPREAASRAHETGGSDPRTRAAISREPRTKEGEGFFRGEGKPLTPGPSPQRGEGSRIKLEFLRSTNNNSWGVGFSEDGLLFGSTANGNPSVYLPIPNRYYEKVRGWSSKVLGGIAGNAPMHPITEKVRQVDYHGHFTAAAGHALYTARTYPKQYWNRTAFVCEPTGHVVSTFVLDRQGTDFKSRNAWNLLASDDEWTSPIMAEVGPDGNVWIIDWYNYIVQHNPTPVGFKTGKGNAYETALRDKTHGRIYRLVMKNAAPPAPAPTMSRDAVPANLVATLKHENMFWRKQAQRLLVERAAQDSVPALLKLAADPSVDAIGLNPGVIQALWTLHGLRAFDNDAAAGGVVDERQRSVTMAAVHALKHQSAGVRRAAAQVLPRAARLASALLPLLDDADPQVRLAALLALAEMPANQEAGQALAQVISKAVNQNDAWLPDALTAAAAAHDVHFLHAVLAQRDFPERRAQEITTIVAEHYARAGKVESLAGLIEKLSNAEPKTTEIVLAALAKGWPKNKKAEASAAMEQAVARLFKTLPSTSKGALLKLASSLGSTTFTNQLAEISKTLLAVVVSEEKGDAERLGAARQAVEMEPEGEEVALKLLAAVTPRTSPQLATGLIDALAGSQASGLGAALVKKMPGLAPAARTAAVRVLLNRPESTRALLDALDKGRIQLEELALDQKQSLAEHPNKKIAAQARKLLERGGGLPSADRQKVLDQLMPLLAKSGDVAGGKLAFKKHCAACHTHSGEGIKIGPDLTGMAVHPKTELLVHIIDPSRSVEGNYRLYQVLTEDGRSMNGLLASETKTSLELYDSQGKKHILQREDVAQLIATPKSLMPDGFEKQLTPDELVNLLEFLTLRGKFLAIPLTKAANVVTTRGMFFSPESTIERLVLKDWGPKTVEGVPFQLVDPDGARVPNAIMLYGPQGLVAPKMPKSVTLPCNAPAKAIHVLSGISGWGYPLGEKGSLTMTVRLHYADGKTEDHALRNGEHFADYIRRVDVPGSKFAFNLRGQQMRYLAVLPQRGEVIERIELVKGTDATAPVVMAVTVETR